MGDLTLYWTCESSGHLQSASLGAAVQTSLDECVWGQSVVVLCARVGYSVLHDCHSLHGVATLGADSTWPPVLAAATVCVRGCVGPWPVPEEWCDCLNSPTLKLGTECLCVDDFGGWVLGWVWEGEWKGVETAARGCHETSWGFVPLSLVVSLCIFHWRMHRSMGMNCRFEMATSITQDIPATGREGTNQLIS